MMKITAHLMSVLIISCLCATHITAQIPCQSISFHWGTTHPTNDRFIKQKGWINPSIEWDYRILPLFSTGISIGYSYSSERGIGNERFDGDLITGYRKKYLSAIPLQIRASLFPLGNINTLLRPYLSIGIGAQYAKFQIGGDYISTSRTANWAEAFSMELGTKFLPQKKNRFFIDARLRWQHAGNSWSSAGIKYMQNLSLNLGAGLFM